MTDRVQQTMGGGDVASAPPPPVPATLKHCWVSDVHGRLPALLLEWRRTGTGFQGRVVRPVYDEAEGWLIVEEWLDSSLLSPI